MRKKGLQSGHAIGYGRFSGSKVLRGFISRRFAATFVFAYSLAALLLLCPATAHAGGGPENLFLIVNSNSEDSLTIANEYIKLRKIPACNVFYINWQRGVEETNGRLFREELLRPILQAIKQRNLESQIDIIAYSADFPWRVNYMPYFKGKTTSKIQRAKLSLNGATYLAKYADAYDLKLLSLTSNNYVQGLWSVKTKSGETKTLTPSLGFRHAYHWSKKGARSQTDGEQYYLSTMLAVTSGRGNTVAESLAHLRRAVSADGTRPPGTIYYMRNSDIRSKTRHNRFPLAIKELKAMGIRAVELPGTLPKGKRDVAGLMLGKATFDVAAAKMNILPGAICEHLTSYGGVMTKDYYHTPLSDFIRAGAAGSSGAVVEPYALQQKFPLPSIHVHYARGCNLAEAYYQSVASPFQLLIVGDPLCQPWAKIPRVWVEGISKNETVQGTIALQPKAHLASGQAPGAMELYIDGTLQKKQPYGKAFSLDTTKLVDGHHELRFVAIARTPIETRGRTLVPFSVNNHDAKVTLRISPSRRIQVARKITLIAKSPGATGILLMHNHRVLGRIQGESGRISVEAQRLGKGRIVLHALSDGTHPARSKPVTIVVE